MDEDIKSKEQSLEINKNESSIDNILDNSIEKNIETETIDTDNKNDNLRQNLDDKDTFALEISINIASTVIIIIGCVGGLLIAKDSIILSFASILLSFSIALILLAIKKLTVIEYNIYYELKILNNEKEKLDLK